MKPILHAAAAAALAIAFVAAGPAAASDEPPASARKTEKIVIIERAGPHAEGTVREVHRLRIEGGGDALAAECAGPKDEVNAASEDGKQRTHIVLCGNTQLSAAERIEKLEHVLSRLEARDDLSPDHKARVTAALREAIERVRSGQ
jgi:hypothetical protein